jgi:hypothetical protein
MDIEDRDQQGCHQRPTTDAGKSTTTPTTKPLKTKYSFN